MRAPPTVIEPASLSASQHIHVMSFSDFSVRVRVDQDVGRGSEKGEVLARKLGRVRTHTFLTLHMNSSLPCLCSFLL